MDHSMRGLRPHFPNTNTNLRGRTLGMEIVLKEKDAADWVYRGEGAANLVLAYTGSSPAFVC